MNLAKKLCFKENKTLEHDESILGDLVDMGSGDITDKLKED